MSYWRDLASRIWNKVKENVKGIFIGVSIAALAIGQVILFALLFGLWLDPYFHTTFGSFLGACAGVLLCGLELLIWLDYEDWKIKQKWKQQKQETTPQ